MDYKQGYRAAREDLKDPTYDLLGAFDLFLKDPATGLFQKGYLQCLRDESQKRETLWAYEKRKKQNDPN